MTEFVGQADGGPRDGQRISWREPVYRVPLVQPLLVAPPEPGPPGPPVHGEYRWSDAAVDWKLLHALPREVAREAYERACRWHYQEVSL